MQWVLDIRDTFRSNVLSTNGKSERVGLFLLEVNVLHGARITTRVLCCSGVLVECCAAPCRNPNKDLRTTCGHKGEYET